MNLSNKNWALIRKMLATIVSAARQTVDDLTRDGSIGYSEPWVNTFDEALFTDKFYYETLRKEVEREDNITHQRITWLMTFQGFLIAAMTFLLSSPWPVPGEHRGIVFIRQAAIGAVGLTGLGLALVSRSGINASRHAIEQVIREWNAVNKQLEIVPQKAPRAFGEGNAYKWGSAYAKLLPFVFVILWIMYLVTYLCVVLWWLYYKI